MLPLELQEWLFNEGYDWSDGESLSGGDTSANLICTHRKAESIFVKYMDSAPYDFFECEAEGLAYLAAVSNVRTPKVLAYGRNFLALEYIKPKQHSSDFWEQLGRQLAAVHEIKRDQSGFVNDNYCGRTPQKNTWYADSFRFFSECRLLPLAEKAYDRSLLTVGDLHSIESICLRLPNIVPEQDASLLHGDLWSGNVHVSEEGLPVLIDPAVYFSWPEIDLAMTTLFGRFDARFYRAYQEVRTLERGWEGRLDLYNLYPLLNHLLLFGSAYLPQVRASLSKYA